MEKKQLDESRILVLGGGGMAGHVIYKYLQDRGYEVYRTVLSKKINESDHVCDVMNSDRVLSVLKAVNPEIVINCVGALVRQSKSSPSSAIYLNSYFPYFLSKMAGEIGFRLIHISTDCVFSGKEGGYSEQAFKDAEDLYGKSKGLGELDNSNDLTLRTSIVGPELKANGEGLFHWFVNQSGEIKGYTRAYWSGITTLELAKQIYSMLSLNLTGLYHITNGIPISKYDLLALFKQAIGLDQINIIADSEYVVDKSLRKSDKFDFQVPKYEQMISEMVNWIGLNRQLYTQYETLLRKKNI